MSDAERKALHDIAELGRAPHEWQSYDEALWEAAKGTSPSSSTNLNQE